MRTCLLEGLDAGLSRPLSRCTQLIVIVEQTVSASFLQKTIDRMAGLGGPVPLLCRLS